jgi:tetratricopeptide (TPR) repeat protein
MEVDHDSTSPTSPVASDGVAPSSPVGKAPQDANDYSRFDGLDEHALSTSEDDSEDEGKPSASSLPLNESMERAAQSKELGNAAFKAGQIDEARSHYEAAIKHITPHQDLNEPRVTAEQRCEIVTLVTSLHGNMAMVKMKQTDWTGALKSSNQVLKFDAGNVKALYRRAQCYVQLSSLAEARADLQKLLEIDPANAPAKKELVEVLRSIKSQQEKERAAFAGAFKSGMYDDREQERLRRQKQAEDEKLRLQDEWTKSKLERREQGLPEQTFEAWKKAREDANKSKDTFGKKTKNSGNSSGSSGGKSSAPATPKTPRADAGEEEAEYDAEDLKVIEETKKKGYCYFRNQPSTETAQLIGDISPKAISQHTPAPAPLPVVTDTTAAAVEPSTAARLATASSWNSAGTWEEKDCSVFVKERLTEICNSVTVQVTLPGDSNAAGSGEEGQMETDRVVNARITSVDKCDGNAHIVLTRGKKRFIYEYNINLTFEVDYDGRAHSGTIAFAEVSPGAELESQLSFKKLPSDATAASHVRHCASGLRDAVTKRIAAFEHEFKSM